ncbi:MAG: response regulator [Spirochaetes bacterium]|nr:response regulator [Spirochaetota bacterium]
MSGMRVIIIDDEPMIIKMLKGYLEDQGFDVASAGTGREGLELISRERFDAAIVDLGLADMEGSNVVIRAKTIQPGIACFIHTGSVDYIPSDELVSLGVDADSVIRKPQPDMHEISRAIVKKVGMKGRGVTS